MKEKDYFASLIKERVVNDARIKARACAPIPHKGFEWRRAAAIAGLSAAALIGTVFVIPSARAEVLSWFGISTPGEYLTTNADDRTEIPEIEVLIASPEPEDGFAVIPIDRTNSKAVNSEDALKLSDFFYQNCDIKLGDAMFDGQCIYQSINMNGLSGLYLLEQWTGGNQCGVKVDPYAVWGLYENGPDKEYLTGQWTLYEHPNGYIVYEMPDGRRFNGMVDLSSAMEPYYESLVNQGLIPESEIENAQEQVDEQNRAYLQQNGVTAVASIYGQDGLTDYADENGNVTAKVFYEVSVCEEDRGDGNYVPPTELFKAQLGTITVNVRAYQDLEASEFGATTEAVVWGADMLTLSRVDIDYGKSDDGYANKRIAFSKQRVTAEGLTMNVEDVKVDALGVHDIKIRIRVPEEWTKEQREALAASLKFKTLINGESGNWYLNYISCTVQEDGSLLFAAGTNGEIALDELPYDMLKSVREISLIPKLHTFTTVKPFDAKGQPLGTLTPDYGEIVWSDQGVNAWDADDTETEFPQYAIVLKLK